MDRKVGRVMEAKAFRYDFTMKELFYIFKEKVSKM